MKPRAIKRGSYQVGWKGVVMRMWQVILVGATVGAVGLLAGYWFGFGEGRAVVPGSSASLKKAYESLGCAAMSEQAEIELRKLNYLRRDAVIVFPGGENAFVCPTMMAGGILPPEEGPQAGWASDFTGQLGTGSVGATQLQGSAACATYMIGNTVYETCKK